jgi:hypothetical protein
MIKHFFILKILAIFSFFKKGPWGREEAQTMYAHVSNHKNNKINKFLKGTIKQVCKT